MTAPHTGECRSRRFSTACQYSSTGECEARDKLQFEVACGLYQFVAVADMGTHLPCAQKKSFQRFHLASWFLLFSTIWGICFSFTGNPNGLHRAHKCTGLGTAGAAASAGTLSHRPSPKQTMDYVEFLEGRCSFTRRSNCALAATMMVERLIATAPTLMGRSTPRRTSRPPATGMAMRLYAVAQIRF